MPQWKERPPQVIDGVTLVVRERTDRRNHLGATEYIIEAYKDGNLIHFERHPWDAWEGHCSGQLLLPLIAERAKNKMAKFFEKLLGD